MLATVLRRTVPAIALAAIALSGCGSGGAAPNVAADDAAPARDRVQQDQPPAPPPATTTPTATATDPVSPAPPGPAPAPADAKNAAAAAPASARAGGPGSMPPASAGTNGSFEPPPPSERKKIVPHTHPDPAIGDAANGRTAVLLDGIALPPPGAPDRIRGAISAANMIVGRPYVWGGGHTTFNASGYDCSGAVSFALGGAGFIQAPLNSGQLKTWGVPGPGQWLTIYSNRSHVYAVIAGLRWDTVGDARGSGPRWHPLDAYPQGFAARHVPGY
jgi:cell wall-associated NlpC family hydrolase